VGNAPNARRRWPGIQGQTLLAAGALVVAAALAVGVTSRAGARAAFRMFLEGEDAAEAEHARTARRAVAAALDGACCAASQLDAASARLGPDLALFAFDEATGTPLGMAGAPLVRLRDAAARWDGETLVFEADRPAEAGSTERVALRVPARGVPVATTDGRPARLHVIPVPSAIRVRSTAAVLAPYDARGLALACGLAVCGALAAWGTAWRTARAARRLEAAALDIASGRLDVRVTPSGPREIVDLARALNTMAEALERRAPSSEETS
jgi:HAMP domain-containing protein